MVWTKARCKIDSRYVVVTNILTSNYCPKWWAFWKWEKKETKHIYRSLIRSGIWYTFPGFDLVKDYAMKAQLEELCQSFLEMEKYIKETEKGINKAA